MTCRFEVEVVRVVREGSITPELENHQQECGDCREAAQVALALRADADALAENFVPPPVAAIWAAAERSRRVSALRRAHLCVRILKVSGFVYALLFALWAAHSMGRLDDAAAAFAALGHTMLAGLGVTGLCVALGLVFALRGERTSLSPPSR